MTDVRRRLGPALFGAALAFPAAAVQAVPCAPAPQVLCLGAGSRFQAEVTWTVPTLGTGKGRAVPLTADTGLFWFFEDVNLELMVKVLDGRPLNRHFWVYFGSLSNVAYTLTVKDTQTGVQEVYQNPAGRFYSGSNTSAFLPEGKARPLAVSERVTAEPARAGPEIPINQTTPGMQRRPDVAVAPDGSFLAVWEGASYPYTNANPQDIYARFYDPEGRPWGNEFRVNERTAGEEWRPHAAASPKGGFMVVWEDAGGGIAGRILDAAGQPLPGEVAFPPGARTLPDVAADLDGGYLVAWRQPVGGVTQAGEIHAMSFDPRGVPSGGDLLISPSGSWPALASLAGGGFAVIWTEGSTLSARRLYFSGQPNGPAVQVNGDLSPQTGYLLGAVPVAHPDGNFSVVWAFVPPLGDTTGTDGGLFARRFTKGSPGLAVPIHRTLALDWDNPAAVSLPSGETWVAWSEWNSTTSADLQAALFSPDWTRLGEQTTVNTYADKEQREPALAGTGNQIVAVWSSGVDYSPVLPPQGYGQDTQDGSFYGVFGQRFKVADKPAPTCEAASNQLCLRGRFRVEVSFTSPWTGQPTAGQPVPLTADTGAFWFFQPANVEMLIKVLDGREVNDHFWVYFGALSDVEYTITVTDTLTHQVKTYYNAPKTQASRADANAF
ncbi:MAG: hypothetical protein ACJ75H_21995 [Thermoanaerobaculia bacterium]